MVVPFFSAGGMRVKIIEGMALGKAIISTPIGAEGIAHTEGKEDPHRHARDGIHCTHHRPGRSTRNIGACWERSTRIGRDRILEDADRHKTWSHSTSGLLEGMKLLVLLSRVPYPLEKGDKLRAYHLMTTVGKETRGLSLLLERYAYRPGDMCDHLRQFCTPHRSDARTALAHHPETLHRDFFPTCRSRWRTSTTAVRKA